MATHDFDIANSDGATVRADLNAVIEALATNNSSATAPPVTFPHMWWFDTTNNLLKQRNAANTAWIIEGRKDAAGWTPYLQDQEMAFATAAESQTMTSLTKLLSPGRLTDAFKGGNQSLAGNGYQKLPGGLVLQWIEAYISDTDGSKVVALPISFTQQIGSRNSLTIGSHFNSSNSPTSVFFVSTFGETLSSVRITKEGTLGSDGGAVIVYALGRGD